MYNICIVLNNSTYVLFESGPHSFYLCFRKKNIKDHQMIHTLHFVFFFYHILKPFAEYSTTVNTFVRYAINEILFK